LKQSSKFAKVGHSGRKMNNRDWFKTLRLLLRQGVTPFDEADKVSLSYVSSLQNILERLAAIQKLESNQLPGRLNTIPNLKSSLCKKLRRQSQDTLRELVELVERMEMSFKLMLRLLGEADVQPDWKQSKARLLSETLVSMYGNEYWRKKQLLEAVDLTYADSTNFVASVCNSWSPGCPESGFDFNIVLKAREFVAKKQLGG